MIFIHLLQDGEENTKIYDLFLQRKSYLPRATAERNMIFSVVSVNLYIFFIIMQ